MKRLLFALAGLLLAAQAHAADINRLQRARPIAFTTGSLSLQPGVLTPTTGGVSSAAWDPTPSPGAQGLVSAYGASEPAGVAWDEPEFMLISAPTQIGVIAFHLNDIAQVGITCDGGPISYRASMTANPDTGVTDYNWTVDSTFSDGFHECRAVAIPNTGMPTVLQGSANSTAGPQSSSLYFTTNFGGTFVPVVRHIATTGTDVNGCGVSSSSPCATIHQARNEIAFANSGTRNGGNVAGGVICLAPGTYNYGNATESFSYSAANLYLTIDSCGPGGAKSNVFIKRASTGGIRTRKVHLSNLTVSYVGVTNDGSLAGGGTGTNTPPLLWAQNVDFMGPGKAVQNSKPITKDWKAGSYFTEVLETTMHDGEPGSMFRNSTVDNIGADALSAGHLIINATVTRIDRRLFATADYTSGSAVISNLNDPQGNIVPGTTVQFCGVTTTISAVDTVNHTATLATACVSTGAGVTILTGAHGDLNQFINSNGPISNVIMYGLFASPSPNTNNIQGWFPQNTVTNAFFVNTHWDNTGGEGFIIFQSGYQQKNWLVKDSTWKGSWSGASSSPGVDVKFINTTCSSGRPGTVSGWTYDAASSTCGP